MTRSRLFALCAPVLAAGALLAQENPALRPAPPQETAPIGSLRPVSSMRDPFRGSPALEGGPIHPGGPTQAPGAAPPPIVIKLVGVLRVAGRAPGALISVGSDSCVVRAGAQLQVTHGGWPSTVSVVEIGQGFVRLKVDGEEREVR